MTGQLNYAPAPFYSVSVRAASDLRPGMVVWPNGGQAAHVVSVVARIGGGVGVITEAGGMIGYFVTDGADGYRTVFAPAVVESNVAVLVDIRRWHDERGVDCCAQDGPFCDASIAYAYQCARRAHRRSA